MKEISLKNKVLDHINNVRDWLDRAETEYQNGASWQGELNLNLAQAELKKAWEVSQQLHSTEKVVTIVSPQVEDKPFAERKWIRYRSLSKNWSGLAAAVVLIMFLGLTPFIVGDLIKPQGTVPKTFSTIAEGTQNGTQAHESFGLKISANYGSEINEMPQKSQINQKAYSQISFSFDEESIVNPAKEVIEENTLKIQAPVIKIDTKPVTLVSGGLKPVSREQHRYTFENTFHVDQVKVDKSSSLDYDLESLIQLAEDALYVKR